MVKIVVRGLPHTVVSPRPCSPWILDSLLPDVLDFIKEVLFPTGFQSLCCFFGKKKPSSGFATICPKSFLLKSWREWAHSKITRAHKSYEDSILFSVAFLSVWVPEVDEYRLASVTDSIDCSMSSAYLARGCDMTQSTRSQNPTSGSASYSIRFPTKHDSQIPQVVCVFQRTQKSGVFSWGCVF